ncbi:hypothetical protein EDD16DRAFT_1522520 [Pisolithus croceorrhizus]|nr:hypothetical protein EDD16DRAFT_1522520 [Pisolithus croceorrhizus]KAI6120560.1 hypothetical protein EV401DRAFT_1887569 [Pisolithus croceorrhizus]
MVSGDAPLHAAKPALVVEQTTAKQRAARKSRLSNIKEYLFSPFFHASPLPVLQGLADITTTTSLLKAMDRAHIFEEFCHGSFGANADATNESKWDVVSSLMNGPCTLCLSYYGDNNTVGKYQPPRFTNVVINSIAFADVSPHSVSQDGTCMATTIQTS